MNNTIRNNKYQSVTALFLSYEPDKILIDLCKELYNLGFNVLVVNDGSSDKYNSIFEEASHFAEIIGYAQNEGKGYAIKYGISHLIAMHKEMKYVITVDGDGQHKISDVIRVADELILHNEIVLGVRKFDKKIPLRSKVGNDMSKFSQTLVTGKYLKDNQCGLRGFVLKDSQWLLSISGKRYEYEMDVISYICLRDLTYREISIEAIYENGNPTSHFRPFADTCQIQSVIFLKGLVSVVAFILQFVLTGIFLFYVFNHSSMAMELSLWCSTGISFVFGSVLNSIIYRPRRKMYLVAKSFLLDITEMIFVTALLELFYRCIGLNIYLAFFISICIAIFPTYLCLKIFNMISWKKI